MAATELTDEVGLLQIYQDELIRELERVDLEMLSKELCKRYIIEEDTRKDFNNLDQRVDKMLKVKYLLQLICVKVCKDKSLFRSFLKILSFFDQLKNLYKSLNVEYTRNKTIEPEIVQNLTEEHIYDLMRQLESVAYKWEEIGIALHIPTSKLSEITREQASIAIKLSRVLTIWITQGTSLKQVTLSVLKEVIASQPVESPIVADKLSVEKFISNTKKPPHLDDANSSPKIVSQSRSIAVSYCKSTLLEVEVTSNKQVAYQWTKEGEPLCEGACYQGTSSSILLVSHRSMASQHIEGRYACEVEDIGRSKEIPVSIVYPDRIKRLLNQYNSLREVPKDTWPPVGTESFIELALIKRESDILKEYDYSVRGDMDDILSKKEKISYKECFGKYRSGVLLVVEGRPGVGKTTLAHKVTRDWSMGKCILEGADHVFLVSLRMLNARRKDSNLSELLDFFYNTLDRDLIQHLESQQGNKSCFILDGLDEYQNYNNENNIIYDLINNNKNLPQAMIIVFSRPVGNKKLKECSDKRFEILGFERDQIHHYISMFFQNEPDKAKNLKKYLSLHINVLNMCYLPVNAAMICYIYTHKDNNMPSTETEIYECFTLLIIIRKVMRDKNSDVPTSLQHLNGDLQNSFNDICKIAYTTTEKFEHIFKRKDTDPKLSDEYDSDGPCLGLVTVNSAAMLYKMQEFYTFLHPTFQYYLAAYHLFSQPEDQQLNIIDQHKDNAAMLVVWKFYCGMISQQTQTFHKQIYKIFNLTYADTLDKVHCAFESQKSIVCDAVIHCGLQQTSLSFGDKVFTPSDYNAISYVISEASRPTLALEFHSCKLQKSGIEHLIQASSHRLEEVKTLLLHLETSDLNQFSDLVAALEGLKYFINLQSLTINFPGRNWIAKGAVVLVNSLKSCTNLQTLSISKNCIGSQGAVELAKGLKSLTILQTLTISENNIGSEGAIAIAGSLRSCTNLQTLNISKNCIGSQGAVELADGLKSCIMLQKLAINRNNIGSEGAIAIAGSLGSCTKLQTLNISKNCIGSQGAVELADGLKSCTILRTLIISKNNIGSEGTIALAGSLKFCTNLQILNISWNSIDMEGAVALGQCLKFCTVLQTLDIGRNNIGLEGAVAPADCLKLYNNLQTLKICWNSIGTEVTVALADCLKYCTNLQILDISWNDIGSEGAKALADGLESCNSLQVLDVSWNNIGSEGAIEIADGLKSFTNLQTLNIDGNNIGSEGAVALVNGLKPCTNLYMLSVTSNSIESDGALILAESLKFCSNLQTLNIRGNNIGSEAAIALTDGLKSYININIIN